MASEKTKRKSEKIGAVMVVGGGIAGMQAALDLANSGYYVYLSKNHLPSAAGCPSWTRPSRPMTVPCELSHLNWSRSADTSTSNY